MNKKENEYKALFLTEALDSYEELNTLLTRLEKDPENKDLAEAIFRITHTLKGNAQGMGFKPISELSHTLEDLFGAIRAKTISVNTAIIEVVYRAVDILGELMKALKTGQPVRYRGVKTKLEVLIKKNLADNETGTPKPEPAPPVKKSRKKTTKTASADSNSTPKAVKKPAAHPKTVPDEQTGGTENTDDPHSDTGEGSRSKDKISFSDSIRVPIKKLDDLLNLAGELIIERDRIIASQGREKGSNEYSRLSRISSDIQYAVMNVRLIQVGFLFNKFHRVVRDAAIRESKKVNLVLKGTETEIDRNILQIISDSLIHLVRNAVGHGIESNEDRKKARKSAEGTVTLSARNDNDMVEIEIEDDGKGIEVSKIKEKVLAQQLLTRELADQLSDQDMMMYIFEPGFSTADQVTAISGRGVGMDVVKKATDSVGGALSVDSVPGKGTIVKLRLPASMAVKATLLFELAGERYAIPLNYTDAVISVYRSDIYKVGNSLVTTHLKKTIPIVFLNDLFAPEADEHKNILQRSYNNLHPEAQLHIVVVEYNDKILGLVVDKLLQQKEVVEKPLAKPVDSVNYISGVTILGNGNVCMVVNVVEIVHNFFRHHRNGQPKHRKQL